jgi:hypothetical protein
MKIRDFIAIRVVVGGLIAIICCSLTISRCVFIFFYVLFVGGIIFGNPQKCVLGVDYILRDSLENFWLK